VRRAVCEVRSHVGVLTPRTWHEYYNERGGLNESATWSVETPADTPGPSKLVLTRMGRIETDLTAEAQRALRKIMNSLTRTVVREEPAEGESSHSFNPLCSLSY
jgi:hypothetical protein